MNEDARLMANREMDAIDPDWRTRELDTLHTRIATLEQENEKLREAAMPDVVRLAIKIVLNHIEPDWNNCTTLVKAWLESTAPAVEALREG